MSPQVWWFLTRASGIVAWLMLTASVIWGIVFATKAFPHQRRPLWLAAMHRWLAGLAWTFLAIHLVALMADSYVEFGPLDLVVPYASGWKPGAIALGVVALWIMAAVQVTSLAQRRLPRKVWRLVHLGSYVTFWLASMHAAYAGTDRSNGLYRLTAAASILAVAWALMYRLANRRAVRRAARTDAARRVPSRA